jgi:hypothetical protein
MAHGPLRGRRGEIVRWRRERGRAHPVQSVGRYPPIGEGGHGALSEEMAVSCFVERKACSLDEIDRASQD